MTRPDVMLTAILLLLCAGCAGSPRAESPLPLVPEVQQVRIIGWDYEPNRFVRLVNELRHLGKKRAIEQLWSYGCSSWPLDPIKNEDVQILVRLLFVNPHGWDAPVLGGPVPYTTFDGERAFERFPFAYSQGIPFLLVAGYGSGGASDPARVLETCADLDLVGGDLRVSNRKEAVRAAEALIKSTAFLHLYRNKEQLTIAQSFVRAQARRIAE